VSTSALFDAPGPKARVRYRLAAIVGSVVVLAFLAFVLYQLGVHGNLAPDKWAMFIGIEVNDIDANVWIDYLLPGLANTLKAAAISIVLAGIFGFVFGTGRMSHVAPIRWVCTVVIEFFRSVPVLVMMLGAFSTRSRPLSPDSRSTTARSSPNCCGRASGASPGVRRKPASPSG